MIDKKYFQDILDDIKNSGLWKEERIITTPPKRVYRHDESGRCFEFLRK